eukprot:1148830-Pelagomonas_calceolata.AAC.1
MDSALHFLSDCQCPAIRNMEAERHNIASRMVQGLQGKKASVKTCLDRAPCGKRGGEGKRSRAQTVRHTFDGESRLGDWNI